jgi:xylan 1,4-beta-xylosidase
MENPIISARMRDPQIVVVGGTYYLTGSAYPFFPVYGKAPGAVLWQSADLIHWRRVGVMVKPSKRYWYKNTFWAAEIFPWHGHFYLTVNCPDMNAPGHPQGVCLACASKITGPYHVMSKRTPLTFGNDGDLFEDSNGKIYCFTAGINAVEVNLRMGKTIGKPFHVLSVGRSGRWDGSSPGAPAVGFEGPSVYKIGKIYYLFYSSWGRGYEVGYATATKYSRALDKVCPQPNLRSPGTCLVSKL